MNELRRALELLVSAVNGYKEVATDQNAIRTEILEVFEPLMSILHDSLTHLQRHWNGVLYARLSMAKLTIVFRG